MKKILFIMLAAITAFASCKDDNTDSGNKGTTSLRITVPSPNAVIFSKALGNNGGPSLVTDHAMRYIIQIWDTEAGTMVQQKKEVVPVSTASVSFDITLNPSKYDFLIWADFVNDASGTDLYYNTASLKDVKKIKLEADYDGDHTRDAFFGAVLNADLTAGGYIFPSVTLKRPFGRIEISANDFDQADPSNLPSEVVLTYSSSLPISFDVSTGELGSTTADNQTFTQTLTLPSGGSELDIAYDYIFAAKDNTTKVAYKVELKNGSGDPVSIRTMSNIPVLRNKRTIISGNFFDQLESDFTGEVSIDDDFEGGVNPDEGLKPVNLAYANLTETSFDLTWDSDGTDFIVEYATDNTFTAGLETIEDISAKTASISGLSAGTTYYVRVGTRSPNTSFTVKSDVLSVTTEVGTTPLFTATAAMQSGNPFAPEVTVKWLNLSATPAKITLTPTSGTTITHTLTTEQVNAGTAVVTSGDLQVEMDYTVAIADGSDNQLQSTTVKTPAVSSNIQILNDGDNLRNAITEASRPDTLFLMPGNYAIGSSTNINQNLVLIGSGPESTNIEATGNLTTFMDGQAIDRIILQNLSISNSGTANDLFSMNVTADDLSFNIGTLMVDNCHIQGKRTLLNSTVPEVQRTSRIGNFIINNVIMKATSSANHIIHKASTDKYLIFDNMKFSNSTFTNTERGLVLLSQSEPVSIDIINCTFHSIMTTTSGSLFFVDTRDTGAASRMNVENSIAVFGGTIPRIVYLGSGTSDSYDKFFCRVNGGTPVNTNSPNASDITIIPEATNDTDIFENPSADPFDSGVSFKVKTVSGVSGLDSQVGDPRWR